MTKFEALQDLCPEGVIGRTQAVKNASAGLTERELELISSAHENRIREFSSGRQLAKGVLKELDFPVDTLGVKADRTPDWPGQILGSISHHKKTAGVVIGKRSVHLRSIGLDLEILQGIHPNFPEKVMTTNETENCRQHSPEFSASCLATFCLKEATYKSMLEFNNQGLSFQDVEFSGWNWDTFFSGEIQTPRVDVFQAIAERLPEGVGIHARIATLNQEITAVVWISPF